AIYFVATNYLADLASSISIPLSVGIDEKPLRPETDRIDPFHVYHGNGTRHQGTPHTSEDGDTVEQCGHSGTIADGNGPGVFSLYRLCAKRRHVFRLCPLPRYQPQHHSVSCACTDCSGTRLFQIASRRDDHDVGGGH